MKDKVYTVTEITKNIKWTLESNPVFNGIWVKGEIFNLTFHSSGHIYFTLKDNDAVISVTFFRNANKNLSIELSEGMSVLAFGSITLFEKRGSYQLNILTIKPEGLGELQKQIELLKQQLEKEGIFDPAKKQLLPFLPKRLGIVTSPTGAAVRDIIKVALRRNPSLEIVIAPAKVQGDDAPQTIVHAIFELNKPEYGIDVIIAGRGGGSFEDLLPFNSEEVVRAICESRVPIVSAVGHQIDHPLSDDAADVAAPTPSAAAEIVVPIKQDLIDEIEYYVMRINQSMLSNLRQKKIILTGIMQKRIFIQPQDIVNSFELLLTDIEYTMISHMKDHLANNRNKYMVLPDLEILIKSVLQKKSHRFGFALSALHQLSPMAVLQRGYAIAANEQLNVLRNVDDIKIDQMLKIFLHDGSVDCSVIKKHKGDYFGKKG